MALSAETISNVLKGLGQKPLSDGEVWHGRFHSEPTLAAACKAKLRESHFFWEVKFAPHRADNSIAYIAEPYGMDSGGGREFRIETNLADDEALILAFEKAVKAGAL